MQVKFDLRSCTCVWSLCFAIGLACPLIVQCSWRGGGHVIAELAAAEEVEDDDF